MPIGHPMSSLEKHLFRSSAHVLIRFFFFFDVELYELFIYLDITSLSVISFANVFSHLVGCLFVVLMVFFTVQKLLSLISSRLFIFACISFALGDRSKKILLQFMSKSVQPVFSSRSFMVSDLTFRSLIHF